MQTIITPQETPKALIVEGGGRRGVFATGVLDAFHDKRFRPFQAYYGISSGTFNLTGFLSEQRGRNLETYSQLSQDPGIYQPFTLSERRSPV